MAYCDDKGFFNYFNSNMKAMGLPAPKSLFGSLTVATATAATILGAIDKLGKTATLAEIIGATTALEGLAVVGALSASFYAGAVIGSLAVATGKSANKLFTCNTAALPPAVNDTLAIAHRLNIYRPWLQITFMKYPGILLPKFPGRKVYAISALA